MWDKILKKFGLHQNKHDYGRRYGKKHGLPEMCGVLRVMTDYTNASRSLKPLSKRNRQISRQFSFAFAYQLCRSYSAE
jgi:hypothetical protein